MAWLLQRRARPEDNKHLFAVYQRSRDFSAILIERDCPRGTQLGSLQEDLLFASLDGGDR